MNRQPVKLYVFHCINSVDADELKRACDALGQDEVKLISLPCSGKLDLPYVVKAFESGADGVVIVACAPGQCQRVEGNLRAEKRVEMVDGLLKEIGLGRGRVAIIETDAEDCREALDKLARFVEKLRTMSKALSGTTAKETIKMTQV
jgi:coenzyme F420-reducing hydrogenase delta subunit